MREQIITIYEEKEIESGKVYLIDQGSGLALSFHNKKGIEIDHISGVVALSEMDSAKRRFDRIK